MCVLQFLDFLFTLHSLFSFKIFSFCFINFSAAAAAAVVTKNMATAARNEVGMTILQKVDITINSPREEAPATMTVADTVAGHLVVEAISDMMVEAVDITEVVVEVDSVEAEAVVVGDVVVDSEDEAGTENVSVLQLSPPPWVFNE